MLDDLDGAAPLGALDDLDEHDVADGAAPAGALDDLDGAAPAGALDDSFGAAPAGAGPRRDRASRWGRLELSLLWRRTLPDAADSSRRDELWLLAIWSR